MRKKKTIELTFDELFILIQELSDLLQKDIKITSKYYLHQLVRIASETAEPMKELIQSLREKHGAKQDNGTIELVQGTDSFKLFEEELEELRKLTAEMTYSELYLADLDGISSERVYGILFKLINPA